MLALKLNVPRNQPDEPSDRTIQSSGWGRENDDYSEPGLPTLYTGSQGSSYRPRPPSFANDFHGS